MCNGVWRDIIVYIATETGWEGETRRERARERERGTLLSTWP